MKLFRHVAVQSMRRNRMRTLVTILGVILSTAMFAAVTTAAGTLVNQLRRMAIYDYGSYYLSFGAVDAETLAAMREDPDTEALVRSNMLGFARLEDGAEWDYYPLQAVSPDCTALLSIHLTEGRLPENSGELVIPEFLAQPYDEHSFHIGDRLTLELGYVPPEEIYGGFVPDLPEVGEKEYTVVGIASRISSHSNMRLMLTGADGTNDNGVYDVYVRTASPDSDALDAYTLRYRQYCNTGYSENWNYLLTLGNFRYSNLNDGVSAFVGFLCLLILIGSVSMIYSAFSISVNERIRQFGLLSSIGATRKQLRSTVLYEALVVCLTGIPLGLLAGCAGLWVTILLLGNRFTALFGDYRYPFRLTYQASPAALLTAAVIAVVTVLISAIIPAIRAMRVTPIEAIRQSHGVRESKRKPRGGKLTYRVFGLPGLLSKRYFRRDRRKYRATVVSLAFSVLLFVTAGTYVMYLTESANLNAPPSSYDYEYYNPNQNLEEYEHLLPKLRAVEGVERAFLSGSPMRDLILQEDQYAESFLDYFASHDTFANHIEPSDSAYLSFCYLDEASFTEVLASCGLTRADYDANPGPILCDRIRQTDYSQDYENRYVYQGPLLSETVTVLPLADISDRPEGQYQYTSREDEGCMSHYMNEKGEETVLPATIEEVPILARTTYDEFFTETNITVAYLPLDAAENPLLIPWTIHIVAPDADDDLTAELTDVVGQSNADGLTSLWDSNRETENLLTIIQVFSYGFIVLISLICVANVFNTISTNVALRRRDFAMLRSIGLTKRGLNGMVCYECLLYGLRALLIGLPLSAGLVYLLYDAVGDLGNGGYRMSVPSILIASGSVFLVVFISMMYAVRKIKKENPVDALKEETA